VKIRTLLSSIAVFAFILVACGDEGNGGASTDSYTGIVTSVESAGLNEVSSFELKSDDETVNILIDDSVNYGFPLGHLEEHRVSAAPVEVAVEERDGELYAQSIVDVEG
jgi:hypothetical protein